MKFSSLSKGNNYYLFLDAEKEDENVGWVNFEFYNNILYVKKIQVHYGFRRKGYAKMLIAELRKRYPDIKIKSAQGFTELGKHLKKYADYNGVNKPKHYELTSTERIKYYIASLFLGILYLCAYLGLVFIATILLTAFGVDMLSAFSGVVATTGNVGPGLGTVGSMSNFSQIPPLGKWVLTGTMLLGRLEIYGLILFFLPQLWKTKKHRVI